MREARIMLWIETWLRDLAYGARLFRRQPAAAALAVRGSRTYGSVPGPTEATLSRCRTV